MKRERTDPYAAVPAYQVEELEAFRKLEYASVGPWRYVVCGDGAPLVMLPGGFMHADMFFYLARHLRGVRTMIPDSYVKQGVVDLAEASAHVEAMLGREGFDAADFIGVSAGGGLVQYLLATSAQLVSRAILSHTGVLEPSRDKEIRRSLLGVRLLPGGLIRRMMRRRTMQDYPESEWAAFARAFVFEASLGFDKRTLIAWLSGSVDSLAGFTRKAWPGRVLILTSRDDVLSYPKLEALRSCYPNADVHVFDAGSHHTLFLFPAEYARIIQAWLGTA